jgi:DNA-binding MarR family transcriptional regulator
VTPDEVAKRFRTRTGYRLANYAEVGIPVYVLSIRVLTLIHKQLPPIEEFVLKALAAGLKTTNDIAAFLGVDQKVVEGGLAELALAEAVSLTGVEGSRFQVLQVTNKGRKILETAEVIEPEERPAQIYFDGIIRRVAWYGGFELLRFRELSDEGLLEIPALPQKRPQLQDLNG